MDNGYSGTVQFGLGYRDGNLADVSGSKALSTTELIHALYKSEEVNGWVHLKDLPISSRLGNKIKI